MWIESAQAERGDTRGGRVARGNVAVRFAGGYDFSIGVSAAGGTAAPAGFTLGDGIEYISPSPDGSIVGGWRRRRRGSRVGPGMAGCWSDGGVAGFRASDRRTRRQRQLGWLGDVGCGQHVDNVMRIAVIA